MSVHISQFYPCSEVSLACELYYICELGKYLKFNHGDNVSLDGVILSSKLKLSNIWDYFRMAVDEGWVVNTGLSADDIVINSQTPLEMDKQSISNYLFTTEPVQFNREEFDKRKYDYDFDIRTPIRSTVSFETKNDDYWLWSINGEGNCHFLDNNKSLNHTRADQSWLSLIAMVAVERLKTQKPKKFLVEICGQVVLNVMALSYIMILEEETSCLNGWFYYTLDNTISENTRLQLSYYAWYAKGRDLGMLDRWYSGKEKFAQMKSIDLGVGDLVMLYEREKSQKQNFIKSIAGCHLAKIMKLDDKRIELQTINTVKTYFQGKEDFDNHTIAVKRMYSNALPYDNISTNYKNFDLADLGVGYMLHNERNFILPLDDCDDVKVTRVSDGVRKDTLLLNQNELIYWILKDYKYDFNEEKFLLKHFPNKEPAYTRYMRGEELEPELYFKP